MMPARWQSSPVAVKFSTPDALTSEEDKLAEMPFHQHQCPENGLLLHLEQPINIGGTLRRAPTAPKQMKAFIQLFLARVRPVEDVPTRFRRLSAFSASHCFWDDMTGTSSQEERIGRLTLDPCVHSCTIEEIRQHAGGQSFLSGWFPTEPDSTARAAQSAFVKNATQVVEYAGRSVRPRLCLLDPATSKFNFKGYFNPTLKPIVPLKFMNHINFKVILTLKSLISHSPVPPQLAGISAVDLGGNMQ